MEFDLAGWFSDAWGYNSGAFDPQFAPVMPAGSGGSVFNPSFKAVTGDIAATRTATGSFGSAYYQSNLLGTEVYLPVQIQVGNGLMPGSTPGTLSDTTYAEYLGVTNTDGSAAGNWYLPNPVICGDIVVQKHIVDTELTERNGRVSELININAFKINVKGFLISPNNEFPEADFITLNRLFNMNIAVVVNNPVTDVLLMQYTGSKTVTLRNLKFMQKKGVKHVVPYELDMVGDLPFNLEQTG